MNKLCTKFALFTRLYRDARSAKHKILPNSVRAERGHSLSYVLVYSNAPYCKILLQLISNKHFWLRFRIDKINFHNHVVLSPVDDFSEELVASIFRVDP
jgi:hypothetical protein